MDSQLQENNDRLDLEFDAARSDLAALRDTLHDHVLTQLKLELALTDPDTAWLSEWLSDTGSMFRLFRRHKFIYSFTLQEIRSISIWRLRVLRPVLHTTHSTLFHCLPPPISDPFGRPMVFLKLASLQSSPCSVKDVILQEIERLRLHLTYIRDHYAHAGSSPLQYLVFVDLDGVSNSIQNYNLDLCSWVLTDIIPRYPGMLAAVFLLNYSWMHSGAWSVAKRIIPSSIIARVFFPSRAQLVSYCSPANLPEEYGGSLPTLEQIDDALRSPYQTHHLPPPLPLPDLPDGSTDAPQIIGVETPLSPSPPKSALQRIPSTISLPPMSPGNPFFGYPVIASVSSLHTIRHVQRGPRELVRTLAVLWWRRWSRWIWASMCAVVLVFVLRSLRRARVGAGIMIGSTMETVATLKALVRAISISSEVRRALT